MYEVFNRHFFKSNGVTFDKIEEIRKKEEKKKREAPRVRPSLCLGILYYGYPFSLYR